MDNGGKLVGAALGSGDVQTDGLNQDQDLLHTSNIQTPSNTITDVYALDATGQPVKSKVGRPFLAVPSLEGPNGERVRFLAVVDNGAMINALDVEAYNRVKGRLGGLDPSRQVLRMADGSLVAAVGTWSGVLQWGSAKEETTFEVFPSHGSWRMLIGKPLLDQMKAVHDYGKDVI